MMCQVETPKDLTPGAEETGITASQTRTEVPSTGAEELSPAVSVDTADKNILIEELPKELEEEPKLRRSKRTTRAGTSRARRKSD
jgi:hypothetical protein